MWTLGKDWVLSKYEVGVCKAGAVRRVGQWGEFKELGCVREGSAEICKVRKVNRTGLVFLGKNTTDKAGDPSEADIFDVIGVILRLDASRTGIVEFGCFTDSANAPNFDLFDSGKNPIPDLKFQFLEIIGYDYALIGLNVSTEFRFLSLKEGQECFLEFENDSWKTMLPLNSEFDATNLRGMHLIRTELTADERLSYKGIKADDLGGMIDIPAPPRIVFLDSDARLLFRPISDLHEEKRSDSEPEFKSTLLPRVDVQFTEGKKIGMNPTDTKVDANSSMFGAPKDNSGSDKPGLFDGGNLKAGMFDGTATSTKANFFGANKESISKKPGLFGTPAMGGGDS